MSGRAATDRVLKGRAAISINDPGHPTPPNWVRAPLTDLADLETGHTPSRNHPEYWDGDVGWLGIRDARAHHGGIINDTAQTVTQLGLENSAARLLPKETVCLSRTASVGYVVKLGRPMATSQDFVAWVCGDALDPGFLLKALLAEGEDIRRFGEGSTHTTIYFPEVKAFHIELPPLGEQRRIVAKLDALTARIARARAELDRLPALARRLRNEAASRAWKGDLTLDLRDGSAAEWPRRPLAFIADVMTGSTPPTENMELYYGGELPFFKPTDLDAGYNVSIARQSLTALGALRSRVVPAGSTLVTCIGATIGKTGFARVECAFNQQINAVVPRDNLANPSWLYWSITSPEFRQNIINNSSATTLPIINKGRFQALELPVPPIKEQAVIAQRLEAIFARADRIEAEAARARALLDRLEASILGMAFRGELVPQDPNDEPASVLLDRIRAERAAAPKPKRGRRPASGTKAVAS